MRLYAIGDVHGRLDLLKQMHMLIEADLRTYPTEDWRIIHLGDYVDRGPDSCGVLDFLVERRHRDSRILALAGNHDIRLLDFLDNLEHWAQFAAFGGSETACSYGIELDFSSCEDLRRSQQMLKRAMPEAHRSFLQSLPRQFTLGDYFFCHAGIRPGVPLDRQDPEDLIWIRREFLDFSGQHPKLVVHGHTPAPAVEMLPNRINVDIEAWRSGRLAALVAEGREKRLLHAEC
jgi:serine/threonine protein phosphatase 1